MQNKNIKNLVKACKKGNLNKVKKIVENNVVDINQVDSDGLPPIYYAVIEGHLDVVSYLISKNVNLNIFVPNPSKSPEVAEHTLLEDCLLDYGKNWDDKFKMAKLLLDNGYDKYYSIEDGTEHLLDIAILFIQKADDFELLKFLLKNFENIHMKIQLLKEPLPVDYAKKQGLINSVDKTNFSDMALASIFNISSSIPMLTDKLIEALDEAILENELENIPILILRLGIKTNTLDNIIETILSRCDDNNYFKKRRYIAVKNNVDLKVDVLTSIQEKLQNILTNNVASHLIDYDSQILGQVYEKILYIKKLPDMSVSKEVDGTLELHYKNSDFSEYKSLSGLINLEDKVQLQLTTSAISPASDMNIPSQINIDGDSRNDTTNKNAITCAIGSILLIPILTHSIYKSIDSIRKLIHKKSCKDKLIHTIQQDMGNTSNILLTNNGNKYVKDGYTIPNYSLSKSNLNFDKDATTSVVDSRKKNPLMQAIEKKSELGAMHLIDKINLSLKDTLGKDSLIYAIENNMPTVAHNILDKLIEQNLNLVTYDSSGKNTIVYAILYNMDTIAKILLDKLSYNINERDECGYTLLDYAFSKNNLDLIKVLLNKGADVTVVDSYKRNFLMQAIEKKSASLILYFIDKIDLSLKDTLGKDSLIYAIENNMPTVAHSILNKFIEKNVSLSTCDSYGKSALMYSIQYHINDVASILINRIPADIVNKPDNKGLTPLDYACINDNKKIITELLKKGFKITNDSSGKNDFYRLVKKSLITLDTTDMDFLDTVSKKCFTTLANILDNDYNFENIFIYCCSKNLNTLANLLLSKKNVSIDAVDNNNETALCHAVRNNNTKIAKYLIQHGANVTATDKHQKTLLMFAIENKNIEIINRLLRKGSDVLAKDKYRKSVLDYAKASNNTQIKNIIQNAINAIAAKHSVKHSVKHKNSKTKLEKTSYTTNESPSNTSNKLLLITASKTNNLPTIKQLLPLVNIDTCDESGKTCLMHACENGSLDIVNYLISNKASVNKLDLNGKSALFYACKNNHIDIVKKLIEKDIFLGFEKPDFGFSVACQKGYLDIVKLLVKNNIPIDPIYNVKSPLMFACESGQLDVVKYLVDNGSNLNLVLDRGGYNVMYFAKKSKDSNVIDYIRDKITTKTKPKNITIPKEKMSESCAPDLRNIKVTTSSTNIRTSVWGL